MNLVMLQDTKSIYRNLLHFYTLTTNYQKDKLREKIPFTITSKRIKYQDFPGGPVIKNPPSNAGDVGSIPGQEAKIPHATGQISPYTTTREPVHHN